MVYLKHQLPYFRILKLLNMRLLHWQLSSIHNKNCCLVLWQYVIIRGVFKMLGQTAELSSPRQKFISVCVRRQFSKYSKQLVDLSPLDFYLWGTFKTLVYSAPINPYPTAFPYGNGMVLHFYQQQESSTTKTVHKVINKGLKAYV